jgi:DNA sulfur modification protein DndC
MNVPSEIIRLIADGALFFVNDSGGKDSQTMRIAVRQIVPAAQIFVIHATLSLLPVR